MRAGDSELPEIQPPPIDRVALRASFLEFARAERRRSPLYARLAEVAADDPEILALFDRTPIRQQRPILLFAALHHLALGRPESDLARCFPTVSRRTADVEGAAAMLHGVCAEWAGDLRDRLEHRSTQTNEVGRAAAVVAGLAWVSTTVTGPLGLVELGASAGLLLCSDRYRVRLGDGTETGPPGTDVMIDCAVRDAGPPCLGPIDVALRRGIDLDPVDVADPERRSWLLACVWADDVERFDRLSAAMSYVALDPPLVEQGDAVQRLSALIAEVPHGIHPVVLNSWALAYVDPAGRRHITDTMASIARHRDLSWLSIESPSETPELPRPDEPLLTPGATELVAWTARDGRIAISRLAELHPHGRWIRWLA